MFTIAIVAHTTRTNQAWNLANQTDAAYVAIDDGTLGCEGNHKRVWQWLTNHNPEPWSVVLEDDAVPCNNFRNQLEQALAVAPSNIVGLYLGHPDHWTPIPTRKQRVTDAGWKATTTDASWILTQEFIHGVGIAIKTELVPDMLRNLNRALPIDNSIWKWAHKSEQPIAFTWPSLVNHHDGPTLIKHRDGLPRKHERKAWNFGTRERWTSRSATL